VVFVAQKARQTRTTLSSTNNICVFRYAKTAIKGRTMGYTADAPCGAL